MTTKQRARLAGLKLTNIHKIDEKTYVQVSGYLMTWTDMLILLRKTEYKNKRTYNQLRIRRKLK